MLSKSIQILSNELICRVADIEEALLLIDHLLQDVNCNVGLIRKNMETIKGISNHINSPFNIVSIELKRDEVCNYMSEILDKLKRI